jgi:hypothetical protein
MVPGKTGIYLDGVLSAGQIYFYMLCSRDLAGNEHQCSPEVTAQTEGVEPPPILDERLYLPLLRQ